MAHKAKSAQQPQLVPPVVKAGLEPLLSTSMAFIRQQIDLLEAFTGLEGANHYCIFNQLGTLLYTAEEEYKGCCERAECKGNRSFVMHIRDQDGFGIELKRSNPKMCCCDRMTIHSVPSGDVLGTVKQRCSICGPRINCFDGSGKLKFIIKGPCSAACKKNITFQVYLADAPTKVIGQITQSWAGYAQEMFANTDNYGIAFPEDLPVDMKAVLLGAAVLIDISFYESGAHHQQHANSFR